MLEAEEPESIPVLDWLDLEFPELDPLVGV